MSKSSGHETQSDYLDSPYTPGVTASFTPGRERQLTRMERALVRVAGQGKFEGRISVLQGARGVGKTSVLRAAERKANALGVTSVFVTAGTGSVLDAVVARLAEIAADEPHVSALVARLRESVSRLTIGVGPIGVELAVGDEPPAPAGSLVHDLKRLVAQAARMPERANRGLLLVIDEVQDMPPLEIRVLATAWQELQAETQNPDEPRLPAVVFAAGLGDVHEAITHGASFGERFHFESLANLSDESAALAVIEPANELGVSWSVDALNQLLELAGGYPYFVQLYADEAWNNANRVARSGPRMWRKGPRSPMNRYVPFIAAGGARRRTPRSASSWPSPRRAVTRRRAPRSQKRWECRRATSVLRERRWWPRESSLPPGAGCSPSVPLVSGDSSSMRPRADPSSTYMRRACHIAKLGAYV